MSMFKKLKNKSSAKVQITSFRKNESLFKDNLQIKSAIKAYCTTQSRKHSKILYEPRLAKTPSPRRENTPISEQNSTSILEHRSKTAQAIVKVLKKSNINPISNKILKSKSDFLEIKRDLATYELSVLKTLKIHLAVSGLQSLSDNLTTVLKKTKIFSDQIEDFPTKINSACKKCSDFTPLATRQTFFPENFGIRSKQVAVTESHFNGAWIISGVTCLVSVQTRFFNEHFISCLLPTNENLHIHIEKNISDYPYKSNPIYKSGVTQKILQFLFINKKSTKIKLEFDESMKKNSIFYLKLIGFDYVTLLIKDFEEIFLFQVKNTNLCLTVEKNDINLKEIESENPLKLKKHIEKNLFVHKNTLVWGEHPFLRREQSSRFLKDGFLSEAFNEDVRQVFEIRVSYKCKVFRVDGFDTKEGKQIKIFYGRTIFNISEDSRDFFLIFGLQSVNFFKDFRTLQGSLEIRILLDRLLNV